MSQISYDKALELINKYVVDNGIRKFCSEVCKGGCCTPHRYGHVCKPGNDCKNIQCTSFLCYDMLKLIPEKKRNEHDANMDYIYKKTGGKWNAYDRSYFNRIRKNFYKDSTFNTERLKFFTEPIQIDFTELKKVKKKWITNRKKKFGY
jgi:hypothetical protein